MAKTRVRVILNPGAAAGRALDRVAEIEAAMRRYELAHEIVLTRARGHATELARAAMADGVDVIGAAGGDGTLHEVVQAYVGPTGEPVAGPDLALLPCGTAGDFGRTLGLSGALEEAVARIRHAQPRPVDLGLLEASNGTGPEKTIGFVNVASFGLSGVIDARIGGTNAVGGRTGRLVGALRAFGSYANVGVRIRVDGVPWYEGPVVNVALANGRYFQAGMRIAPHADPSDGRLEIVVLGDLRPVDLLTLARPLFLGSHLSAPGVAVTSGRMVQVEAVHPWAHVLFDVDGEQRGRLPAVTRLAPGALRFRA